MGTTNNLKNTFTRSFILFLLISCLAGTTGKAQSILTRVVTFEVNRVELAGVLEILSNKGNFFFSYNSHILRKDSLVTLNVHTKTVKHVLDLLFREGYEYKESGNYIILRRKPIQLTLVNNQAASEDNLYYVSGYVYDDQTGEKITNASVYERNQLVSAITNGDGYFKLRLKSRYRTAAISVSRQYYVDTTVHIQPKFNQDLNITMMPVDFTDTDILIAPYNFTAPDSIMIAVRSPDSTHWLYTYRRTDSVLVERTSMGRFLVTSWQKIQSINLKKFFTVRPYQMSLIPGMSTNGRLNSQVINNISLNMIGGYSGGVNGVEIAGAFNIDKKDVKYVQVAGLLNIVGGRVTGAQIAGIQNTVLDSVNGFQAGGIGNFVKRDMLGVQAAGIYNHVSGNARGAQVAGIGNFTRKNFIGWQLSGYYNVVVGSLQGWQLSGAVNLSRGHSTGMQLAGLLNVNLRDMNGGQVGGLLNVNLRDLKGAQIASLMNVNLRETRGLQLSTLLNYTKKLKGVQIGLINIADTSDGYSIGLINIILKGYHKLSLYTTEVIPFNAAFKTGNTKLYSILLAGISAGYRNENRARLYSVGYGLGKEFALGKKKKWSLNPEITSQHLYLGSWDYVNVLNRIGLQANFKLGKLFSIFAGPAYNIYYSNQTEKIENYKFPVPSDGSVMTLGKRLTGWFGFHAGISFF